MEQAADANNTSRKTTKNQTQNPHSKCKWLQ